MRKMLQKIAGGYPKYLSSLKTRDAISFETLDQAASAGHLITSMLGREKRYGPDRIELVSWEEWASFHIELLHALSNTQDRLLEKLPQSEIALEYHAETLERFATYLAAMQTLSRSDKIEPEDKARLSIGLFRITKIFGFEKSNLDKKQITKHIRRFLGSAVPELLVPDVDWDGWTHWIAKATQIDEKLRVRFKTAGEVADSNQGAKDLLIGDWIWWPHTDGHMAIVVGDGIASIEAAYEPCSTKKLAPNYVVRMNES
jgi:hypothetical protein